MQSPDAAEFMHPTGHTNKFRRGLRELSASDLVVLLDADIVQTHLSWHVRVCRRDRQHPDLAEQALRGRGSLRLLPAKCRDGLRGQSDSPERVMAPTDFLGVR